MDIDEILIRRVPNHDPNEFQNFGFTKSLESFENEKKSGERFGSFSPWSEETDSFTVRPDKTVRYIRVFLFRRENEVMQL